MRLWPAPRGGSRSGKFRWHAHERQPPGRHEFAARLGSRSDGPRAAGDPLVLGRGCTRQRPVQRRCAAHGGDDYATVNFEFPVKAGVRTDPLIESWGAFKADSLSLEDVARNRAAASKLVDKTGFDAGPQG